MSEGNVRIDAERRRSVPEPKLKLSIATMGLLWAILSTTVGGISSLWYSSIESNHQRDMQMQGMQKDLQSAVRELRSAQTALRSAYTRMEAEKQIAMIQAQIDEIKVRIVYLERRR